MLLGSTNREGLKMDSKNKVKVARSGKEEGMFFIFDVITSKNSRIYSQKLKNSLIFFGN